MLTLTASGTVSDYADTSALQSSIATVAGVDASVVTINVAAASVIITATIAVPTATTAAAVQTSLAYFLPTAAAASAALGITVEEVPATVVASPPSPPSPPPPSSSPSSPSLPGTSDSIESAGDGSDDSLLMMIVVIASAAALLLFCCLAAVLLRRRRLNNRKRSGVRRGEDADTLHRQASEFGRQVGGGDVEVTISPDDVEASIQDSIREEEELEVARQQELARAQTNAARQLLRDELVALNEELEEKREAGEEAAAAARLHSEKEAARRLEEAEKAAEEKLRQAEELAEARLQSAEEKQREIRLRTGELFEQFAKAIEDKDEEKSEEIREQLRQLQAGASPEPSPERNKVPAALARARQANRSTSNVNLKRADSQSQLGSASSSNLKLSRAGPPSDAPSTSSLQLNRVAEPPQSDALPSQGGAGSSSCGESSTDAGAGKSTSGGASAEERPEPVPPATEPAVAVTASSAPAVNGETTPQDAGPKLEFAQISRVSFGDGGGGGGAKRQPRSRNHKKPSPLQTAKSGKLGMWLQERGLGAAEGALKENGIERLDDLLDFTSREDLEVLELDGQLVDVDHLLQEISKSSTSPGAPQGASGGASADEPARSVSEDEMPDGITSTMAS